MAPSDARDEITLPIFGHGSSMQGGLSLFETAYLTWSSPPRFMLEWRERWIVRLLSQMRKQPFLECAARLNIKALVDRLV